MSIVYSNKKITAYGCFAATDKEIIHETIIHRSYFFVSAQRGDL